MDTHMASSCWGVWRGGMYAHTHMHGGSIVWLAWIALGEPLLSHTTLTTTIPLQQPSHSRSSRSHTNLDRDLLALPKVAPKHALATDALPGDLLVTQRPNNGALEQPPQSATVELRHTTVCM